jgi:methylenetetrahydrofolate--tRNA-(uracil-5-)-methyltransferase
MHIRALRPNAPQYYIYAPDVLKPTLQCRQKPQLFIAGRSAAWKVIFPTSPRVAGRINAARYFRRKIDPTATQLCWGIVRIYFYAQSASFSTNERQFRLIPPFENKIRNKTDRYKALCRRSSSDLNHYLNGFNEAI